MTLRMREVEIENVNHYPEAVLTGLREALRGGAEVVPDPKRANFYMVLGGSQTFYIDVLRDGHRVILLGAWSSVN